MNRSRTIVASRGSLLPAAHPSTPDFPGMKPRYIDTPSGGEEVARVLSDASQISLDSEAAGFHRYSDRICLVQLTVDDETFLIDPLSFDPAPALREALERPETTVLMHGADYDIRLLDRDLGIHLQGLFDTQVAAALLGEEGLGLSALLEKHFGIRLSKKHQRADWAMRPLTEEMLDYAASDTLHLAGLAELLRGRLEAAGRLSWAEEEFRRLQEIRSEVESGEPQDPVTRFKRAWELPPRILARLREALIWRDGIARAKDRAPFRVAGDPALLAVAHAAPRSTGELESIQGFPSALARTGAGDELVERIREVDGLPDRELVPYPPRVRKGFGRPLPEVEALAEKLKVARNRVAESLGLDRGTILSNSMIAEIARIHPRESETLRGLPGIRAWQIDLLEDPFLRILRETPRPPG